MTYVYWLNTQTDAYVRSNEDLYEVDQHGTRTDYYAEAVLAAGYLASLMDRSVPAFFNILHASTDTDVLPVRMTQRDDGYGANERHGRIRLMHEEKASSASATVRIFGSGSNTYH